MAERTVSLHLYDVSRGLASRFSPILLGRPLDGLWHTNVVVGDREFSYGPPVRSYPVGASALGAPSKVIPIGMTSISDALLDEMSQGLARGKYSASAYDLLYSNCNHFANDLALLLTGNTIPDEVLGQTQAWMEGPLGEYLMSRWQAKADAGAPAAAAHPGVAADATEVDMRPADAPSTSTNPPNGLPGAQDAAGAGGAAAGVGAGATPFEGLLRDLMRGFVAEQGGHPAAHAVVRNVMQLVEEAIERFTAANADEPANGDGDAGRPQPPAAAAGGGDPAGRAAAGAGCGRRFGSGGCAGRWGPARAEAPAYGNGCAAGGCGWRDAAAAGGRFAPPAAAAFGFGPFGAMPGFAPMYGGGAPPSGPGGWSQFAAPGGVMITQGPGATIIVVPHGATGTAAGAPASAFGGCGGGGCWGRPGRPGFGCGQRAAACTGRGGAAAASAPPAAPAPAPAAAPPDPVAQQQQQQQVEDGDVPMNEWTKVDAGAGAAGTP